jgi:hypothetical protein
MFMEAGGFSNWSFKNKYIESLPPYFAIRNEGLADRLDVKGGWILF